MKKENPVFAFSKPFESKPLSIIPNKRLDNDELVTELESLLNQESENIEEDEKMGKDNLEKNYDNNKIDLINNSNIEKTSQVNTETLINIKKNEVKKDIENKNDKTRENKPSSLPKSILFPEFTFSITKPSKIYEETFSTDQKTKDANSKCNENKTIGVLKEKSSNINSKSKYESKNEQKLNMSIEENKNKNEKLNPEDIFYNISKEFTKIKNENSLLKNKILIMESERKKITNYENIMDELKHKIFSKIELIVDSNKSDKILEGIEKIRQVDVIKEIIQNRNEIINSKVKKNEFREIYNDENVERDKILKNFIENNLTEMNEIKKKINHITENNEEKTVLMKENQHLINKNQHLNKIISNLEKNKSSEKNTILKNKNILNDEIVDIIKDIVDLQQKMKDLSFYKELKKTIIIQKNEFLKSKIYYEEKIRKLEKEIKKPKRRKIIEPLDSDVWNVFK